MAFRKGMWVLHGPKIGILNNLDAIYGEVHYVAASGETAGIATDIPLAELTQAKAADIPEPRRPDEATARALGYL